MSFKLPDLPYAKDALDPYISKETLEYHHNKHHRAYVDNLNKLIKGTLLEKQSLEEIIRGSEGSIFNNAAQSWNHTFYWQCMSSNASRNLSNKLASAIREDFSSMDKFKELFTDMANKHFASGWIWLVKNKAGKLEVLSTANAGNPMTDDKKPLLTCDVWEHAYYIDTRNNRQKYVNNFWQVINWHFVEENFES
ncbi:superoxide dismutase [Coxiella endosymbiont of Amblyomma nuttalli]|uniref:superoxide dismutase n=1 Tax=Coxiella endosymbiont of Amblyomma nuttalli TaxID=2749996 RepID=UPI001BA8A3A1|nr:Fe-Mn family superoxide dismutase [Coxiella endosymbiont of Amblyomma nuttalli]QTS83734.1 Superoxide dismutase [Fe] [Coxiella endosymbiont of Amblyomma nuttalli]